ncbi:trehalose synthase [Tuber indicum]|nr:trehalose synthase [Tuber indicum]
MNDPETPHTVKYPLGTVTAENIRTEETAWGDINCSVILFDDTTVKIGFSIHDGLRVVEGLANLSILSDGNNMLDLIRENTIHTIVALSKSLGARFVAASVELVLEEMCPGLSTHIWRRLDVVCVLSKEQARVAGACDDPDIYLGEKADSAAQECVSCFSPDYNPARTFGFRNQVMPDAEMVIKLVDGMRDYEGTFHKHTSTTVLKYIPEPDAEAFRITQTNHNLLQGVANPEVRFDAEKQASINEWIRSNAERYWLTPGGPLAPGGADVVVIDDPQMPVRKDLVEQVGSPQERVWQWILDYMKDVDVIMSHAVEKSVHHSVPFNTIGLMPACTDRLDGQNKPLRTWDLKFYHRNFRIVCNEQKANHLLYPAREYITQIARFDPSKGIPDVIESYHQLCNRITRDAPEMLPPQSLICGHGAIDDPDAEIVFAETRELLQYSRYATIANDVAVVRIEPWKIVLQLSLLEGLEVKVSEALRHGKPVVATRAAGISWQIEHGKSGFLVDVGDTEIVANHIFDLYTNRDRYSRMIKHAKASLARGKGLAPRARWTTDMATEEAGQKYEIGQPILPRNEIDFK